MGDDDLATIRAVDADVAHCPLSNVYFADAVLPARSIWGRLAAPMCWA